MATAKRKRATFEQVVKISEWMKTNREECEQSTEVMLQVKLLADTGIDVGPDTVGELLKANGISRTKVKRSDCGKAHYDRVWVVAKCLQAVMEQLGAVVPDDLRAVVDRKGKYERKNRH